MTCWLDVSPLYWPDPSGISIQLHELAQQGASSGADIQYINYLSRKSRLSPVVEGVRWVPGCREMDNYLGVSPLNLLVRNPSDLFLATAHFVPKISARVWYFLYDLIRVKFAHLYHSSFDIELAKLKKRMIRAERIVVPSMHTARDMQELLQKEVPFYVLPAGIDVSWFSNHDTSEDRIIERELLLSREFVYSNGLMQERKRFDWSFRLAERLKMPLVITGSINAEVETRLIVLKRSFPTVPVLHLGLVSRGRQRALYQKCALFAFPTLYEGFGMPVLEAMAAGSKVIASNNSSIPEIISDAAQRFETHDFDEFFEKAKALVSLPKVDSLRLSSDNKSHARKFDIANVAATFWNEVI